MADALVIGAGLAGCSVAWHLAPHASVLVLEQGAAPGAEATAQNAGMIRRMGEGPEERALALRTAAFLEDPGEDWADAAPSRRTGAVLGLAHDPTLLHDAAAHLRARGVRVESCADPSAVAPALAGAPLRHAWYLPDERVAEPQALIQGFLRGLSRHGGAVRCGVQVRRLLTEGRRVIGVETDEGPIHAGAVILAAGAWSGALAAGIGLRRPLIPLRRPLLVSAPHPLSRPDHPWCWVEDAGVYLRPAAGGWLLSGCEETPDPPPPGPGSAGALEEAHRALAMAKVERYFPAVRGLALRGGWTGLRTFAPDRAPVLGGDPDAPGLWWAAGLGGFGVSGCFGAGEAVAAWLRGEETAWLRPAAVSPGRGFLGRWPIRPTGDISRPRLIGAEELSPRSR